MPKHNTEKPPLAREPIVTHNHTQASSSVEQLVQYSDTIPVTHGIEKRISGGRYIFVSPTRGAITVKQLLKGNFDSIARL